MRKYSLFIFIFLSTLSLQLVAQSPWCGINADDAAAIKDQLLQNREEMRDVVLPRNAITYVPVRFHLVAKSDGTGRANESFALEALCHMNENYPDLDIQFYLKEFKYYNNSTVFNDPGSPTASFLLANQMIYDAINVFVVLDAGDGAAAYYQPPAGPSGNDWIVSSASYVDDVRVLTHEVGHFFSLPHPFNGWESSGGWDENIHGNPVTFLSPDGVPNERVDGSNCQTAGDAICDTPADYMFPTGNCTYNLSAKDPNGETLEPDLQNFMNYAFNCDEYYFTADQKTAITNSLFSSNRNYIRPNYTPVLDVIEEKPTLIYPAASETVETYNSVPLEWTEVDGATNYIVEVSSPVSGTVRYHVTDNSMVVTGLEPNKSYLWRVLGYNEYSTCFGYTSQKIFKTGDTVTDTAEIPLLAKWSVQPNPARSNGTLFVNVESVKGIVATVSLVSITGQVVRTYPDHQFPGGLTTLELSTDGIAGGIYLVTLQSSEGFETRKVSIVE